MRNAPLVADLKCSGCGRTLVRDGCLKCTRCDALVLATLGEKRIHCSNCSNPRVLLARNDEAMCPESKSRCANRRENKGTPMKLALNEETHMTQEAIVQEAEGKQAPSKTKELRDWLDLEIGRCAEDEATLEYALKIADSTHPYVFVDYDRKMDACGMRYGGLTSDEREAKMAEDRKKLEELKKRLELLRSARELDVDIDALERAGLKIWRAHSEDVALVGEFDFDNVHFYFEIDIGKRKLYVKVETPGDHTGYGYRGYGICTGDYISIKGFKVTKDPHFYHGYEGESNNRMLLHLPGGNVYPNYYLEISF